VWPPTWWGGPLVLWPDLAFDLHKLYGVVLQEEEMDLLLQGFQGRGGLGQGRGGLGPQGEGMGLLLQEFQGRDGLGPQEEEVGLLACYLV